jgi:hypothetical protein
MHELKLLEVLVKLTIKGAQPIDLFNVKDAVGLCANENLCNIKKQINVA